MWKFLERIGFTRHRHSLDVSTGNSLYETYSKLSRLVKPLYSAEKASSSPTVLWKLLKLFRTTGTGVEQLLKICRTLLSVSPPNHLTRLSSGFGSLTSCPGSMLLRRSPSKTRRILQCAFIISKRDSSSSFHPLWKNNLKTFALPAFCTSTKVKQACSSTICGWMSSMSDRDAAFWNFFFNAGASLLHQ